MVDGRSIGRVDRSIAIASYRGRSVVRPSPGFEKWRGFRISTGRGMLIDSQIPAPGCTLSTPARACFVVLPCVFTAIGSQEHRRPLVQTADLDWHKLAPKDRTSTFINSQSSFIGLYR